MGVGARPDAPLSERLDLGDGTAPSGGHGGDERPVDVLELPVEGGAVVVPERQKRIEQARVSPALEHLGGDAEAREERLAAMPPMDPVMVVGWATMACAGAAT